MTADHDIELHERSGAAGRRRMFGGDDASIVITLPRWYVRLLQLRRRLTLKLGRPRPAPHTPTFIWPAVSAGRWAAMWTYAMLEAGPPHHTWKWVLLLPFCVHSWRAITRLHVYLTNRYRQQHGLTSSSSDGTSGPPPALTAFR